MNKDTRRPSQQRPADKKMSRTQRFKHYTDMYDHGHIGHTNSRANIHHRAIVNRCLLACGVVVVLLGVGGVTTLGYVKTQQDHTEQMAKKLHRKPKVVYRTKIKYKKSKGNDDSDDDNDNPDQAAINRKADQLAVDKANRKAYDNAQKATNEKVKQANAKFNKKLDELNGADNKTLSKQRHSDDGSTRVGQSSPKPSSANQMNVQNK